MLVAKNLNSTKYGIYNTIETINLTDTETEYEVPFTVEDSYCIVERDTPARQYTQGYSNNVSNISVMLGMTLDNSGSQSVIFHSPKIEKI